MVEAVQSGQSSAGVEIQSRELILFGLRQTGTQGLKYDKFLNIGASSNKNIGQTPFEAIETLQIVSPEGNFTETAATKTLEVIANQQADKYRTTGAKVPTNSEILKAEYNQMAGDFMKIAAKEIVPGDDSNPYAAPPMATLAAKAAVANSPLYAKVLKTMNMVDANPQAVMDAAVVGVRAGIISPEEAAMGIATLYKAAVAHNNTFQGGYERVGLPTQKGYNSRLTRPAGLFEALALTSKAFGVLPRVTFNIVTGDEKDIASIKKSLALPSEIVDLTDPSRVQQLVVQYLNSSLAPAPTKEETK